MELNLLSVSQMLRHSPRMDVTFSSHQCTITDRETQFVVAVGLEDHGLFRLADSGTSQDLAMAARQSSVSSLWHQRYGHLNVCYLSQLSRDELVLGLLEIQTQQLGVCNACQAGKQHRTPFLVGNSWRASQVLQLVHADICSPMATPFVLGSRSAYMKAHDLGVRLPLGPSAGRAPAAQVAPVVPMILAQTPPTSPTGSPRYADASPDFDPDSSDEEPDHRASLDHVGPPLRPKWWAKTVADLRDDELIEGRTARKKSKPRKTVNIALMANIHSVFEPQTYSEAKGILEWEQAMNSEHQSLLKNHTWVLSDQGRNPLAANGSTK